MAICAFACAVAHAWAFAIHIVLVSSAATELASSAIAHQALCAVISGLGTIGFAKCETCHLAVLQGDVEVVFILFCQQFFVAGNSEVVIKMKSIVRAVQFAYRNSDFIVGVGRAVVAGTNVGMVCHFPIAGVIAVVEIFQSCAIRKIEISVYCSIHTLTSPDVESSLNRQAAPVVIRNYCTTLYFCTLGKCCSTPSCKHHQ